MFWIRKLFISGLVFEFFSNLLAMIRFRLSVGQVVLAALFAILTITVGIYWTAIKQQYRYEVSKGEKGQVVYVDKLSAGGSIIRLVSETTPDDLIAAADDLLLRFAEIDMFSAVVDYVPRIAPHAGGGLWYEAISRPFMPRILFPNKAVIDKSLLTNQYTGLAVSGAEQGTQISMGYLADAYIDFGGYGMMGVVFAFGYFLGYLYQWLLRRPNAKGPLGFGLGSATLFQLDGIGVSSAKIVGSVVVMLLVAVLVIYFVAPRYLAWAIVRRPSVQGRQGLRSSR